MKAFRTLIAAMALACPLAHASLINHGDGSFADTDTGYVWRALDQYAGLDYASAVSLLPTGYHVATEAELASLAAAIPAVPGAFDADATTTGAAGAGIIWGFYGDGSRYAWRDAFDTSWNTNAANGQGWTDWNYGLDATTAFSALSLFAVDTDGVQAAVPEPSTLALLGLGVALVAGRRRGAA
jgi:hypothetical protein